MCAILLCRHRARYRKFTDARSKKRYALLHRISPVQRVQKLGISIDPEGRTIWIADAHRGDGKRFVVRADEKLTAFMELECAIRAGELPWLARKSRPEIPHAGSLDSYFIMSA